MSTDYSDCIPATTRIYKQCDPVPCEDHDASRPTSLLGTIGGTITPIVVTAQMRLSTFSVSFPNAWNCPFRAMISCQATRILSPQDRIALLCGVVLAEHVVDIHKVKADFRDASERKQSSSSQTYGVNKYFSSQSPVQRRLSIYNWNLGPRRGSEDAFEKQIAGKWHIATLQEASDCVDHDIIQERFHVTHYLGCAILFDKDTFYPDINVNFIYLLGFA